MSESDEGSDQHVEMVWETPSHAEIVEITKLHVGALEATDDDAVWVQAGMHHVLLHTIGRRSGNEHKIALPFWRDDDGHRIVVGSFAGAVKDPAWILNLRDRTANPGVKVRVQDGLFWSEHEILEGAEREPIWEQLCADRAWYRDYQGKTDRIIPLVRLPETRPLAD
jgi:deazaflavin-dependent oxidoreductase (nitroreductase family)